MMMMMMIMMMMMMVMMMMMMMMMIMMMMVLSFRLLWLLEEYVGNVETDSAVAIETENIQLQVVNHTTPEDGFHYAPKLALNEQALPVRSPHLKLNTLKVC